MPPKTRASAARKPRRKANKNITVGPVSYTHLTLPTTPYV